MKLSICFGTYNEEKNITRLLSSIINSKGYNSSDVEIIVTDSVNTKDSTRSLIEQFSDVKLYVYGNERSMQRNNSVKQATGEYVLIPDADMEFSEGLLEELLHFIDQHTDKKSCLVVKESVPGKTIYSRARNIEKKILEENATLSAARLFPREKFIEVGGFNEEMVSGEDFELDRRFRKLGYNVFFSKNYFFHHEESLGIIKSVKKKIYYAKKLINYTVVMDTEFNPLYRYAILFSKPMLILRHPIAFTYLIILKSLEFGIGFLVYMTNKKKD